MLSSVGITGLTGIFACGNFFIEKVLFMSCSTCFYNFDGVCAWHSSFDDNDTYGHQVGSSVCLDYCNGYRKNPSFLTSQNEDE